MKSRFLHGVMVLLIGLHLSFTVGAKTTPLIFKPAAEPTHEQYYLAQSKCRSADLDRAVSRIRKRTGGQVLSCDPKKSNGKDVLIIRTIKDGKVQRHKVDAATGRSLPRRSR